MFPLLTHALAHGLGGTEQQSAEQEGEGSWEDMEEPVLDLRK